MVNVAQNGVFMSAFAVWRRFDASAHRLLDRSRFVFHNTGQCESVSQRRFVANSFNQPSEERS